MIPVSEIKNIIQKYIDGEGETYIVSNTDAIFFKQFKPEEISIEDDYIKIENDNGYRLISIDSITFARFDKYTSKK